MNIVLFIAFVICLFWAIIEGEKRKRAEDGWEEGERMKDKIIYKVELPRAEILLKKQRRMKLWNICMHLSLQ